jgi:5'-phosphate synthase pdxT subunit
VDSFEAELEDQALGEGVLRGVFIRAPVVERFGEDVEVLAQHDGRPVALQQSHLIAAAFHPELIGERRLHRRLLERVG